MILFHASKLAEFRGDYVLPTNYWYRNRPKLVHLANTEDGATRWVKNKLSVWSLWTIDSKDVPGLVFNPKFVGSYQTEQKIPVSSFRHLATYNTDRGELQLVAQYVEGLINGS